MPWAVIMTSLIIVKNPVKVLKGKKYKMHELKSALDVYKILKKENCGGCGLPSCMAFAVSVISRDKILASCRRLDQETIKKYSKGISAKESTEKQMINAMRDMKNRIASISLEDAAERIGAPWTKGEITIHCMGKKVTVDREGNISTRIHVNPWMAGPIYNYIISGGRSEPKGEWVHFRDFKSSGNLALLFSQRCEKPCKKIADLNPKFFDTLLEFFSGEKIESQYESDISQVLWPLPRLPILISYWKAEGSLPSELNIFFDSTAEKNLAIENIFTLGVGLVAMLEKIMSGHSHTVVSALNKLKKTKEWCKNMTKK